MFSDRVDFNRSLLVIARERTRVFSDRGNLNRSLLVIARERTCVFRDRGNLNRNNSILTSLLVIFDGFIIALPSLLVNSFCKVFLAIFARKKTPEVYYLGSIVDQYCFDTPLQKRRSTADFAITDKNASRYSASALAASITF